MKEYDSEENCPCDTCNDKDFCDGWEAMFCCTLCGLQGTDCCDDCDPFDI